MISPQKRREILRCAQNLSSLLVSLANHPITSLGTRNRLIYSIKVDNIFLLMLQLLYHTNVRQCKQHIRALYSVSMFTGSLEHAGSRKGEPDASG
jgi:hypothetical protein